MVRTRDCSGPADRRGNPRRRWGSVYAYAAQGTARPATRHRVTDPALVAALRARGSMMLRLPIAPEGIAGLVQAGWLTPRVCRDRTAVADALVDSCDAGLDAHLQPKHA